VPTIEEMDEWSNPFGVPITLLATERVWPTYHLHMTKLCTIFREIYRVCDSFQAVLLREELPAKRGRFVQRLAEPFPTVNKALESWMVGVPFILQTQRCATRPWLCVDSTTLTSDQYAPLWLQKQRLSLECTYYTLCADL
jgi:hypothetical protein